MMNKSDNLGSPGRSCRKRRWKPHWLAVFAVTTALSLVSCSEEQQNKLSRLGVSWLEGDYRVTYADGSHVKSWIVDSGKVTSEPQKGYYYFWAKVDGKKVYVQTPIGRTYIEEIK